MPKYGFVYGIKKNLEKGSVKNKVLDFNVEIETQAQFQ